MIDCFMPKQQEILMRNLLTIADIVIRYL